MSFHSFGTWYSSLISKTNYRFSNFYSNLSNLHHPNFQSTCLKYLQTSVESKSIYTTLKHSLLAQCWQNKWWGCVEISFFLSKVEISIFYFCPLTPSPILKSRDATDHSYSLRATRFLLIIVLWSKKFYNFLNSIYTANDKKF